jgi:anthranilate synthase component 1
MSEAFLEKLPLVRATGDGASARSRFMVRGIEVGGKEPVIIAGPCAVESADQILEIAKRVKAEGAQGLRGGVYKPRSSPYSFQGLGEVGLEYLAAAREKVGLFTVVEVTSSEQIAQVMDYVDVIQIGARNMQNFELLKAVGRIQKPILLKRGFSATIQELLQAAEYILYEGNPQVILCERGIRTFETITRNTLDINAIPLLKQLTHLPVFADPSHGTGRSDLVIPVAKAALSAGANGLIIEVHPDPAKALSDGNQSLDFPEFSGLMKELNIQERTASRIKTQISPSFEKFTGIVKNNDYRYIPVQAEFITDSETPVTVFAKLAQGPGRFLLESVERGEQVGRYSFIGWNPLVTLKATGNHTEIMIEQSTKIVKDKDPLAVLKDTLDSMEVAPTIHQEKFFGGAVGYIGYDYVRQIEKIPLNNPITIDIPDLNWIIPKYLTTFDHVSHKITVIVLVKAQKDNIEKSYQNAVADLEDIIAKFHNPADLQPLSDFQESGKAPCSCSLTKEEYMERVERIKEYINAGDAFQVVLSQRIEQPFDGKPLLFYRLLRTINPSPYLFYLDFGEFQLAGSSPEVMVRKEEQTVTLKPIAGTRPRGASVAEDEKLRQELIKDEKERAEHTMLVDLGRNDLGRVCKFGTVAVTDLMNIENYSHVMHIVSTINGQLIPTYSGVDLLRAVFPAGTLSGAPKVRAMEIIEEMEPIERGFYGGTVGYLGFNGNLDTCITIRTVLFKDHKAVCQVGAGIVADSVPEKEYQETMNKAGALLDALAKVGGKVC